MLKKLLWILLAVTAGLAFWRFGYPASLRYFFKVGGTVKLGGGAAQLKLPANSMLFVIAKNESGIPIAVKKIINPYFPVNFEISPSNLIMPDLLTRRVYLEAFMNTHGHLGAFRKGDLKGEYKDPVAVFRKDIVIQLEQASAHGQI
ncbi:MAG: hypothetical protein A2285_02675 [Elusimicrobia bacterium RIFOXYA12_FULL_57_11]|nr:MAG: hypothetical protein A2285_02675 [Elusimicrobia bacterium RIFOXYA12_FULL_57_11]